MLGGLRRRFSALAIGLARGFAGALFLAPKRRGDKLHGGRSAAVADAALDASRAAQRTLQWIWSYASRSRDLTDIAPDERAALRIRAELERRGIWAPRLDVTLIDGTAYLRGREADPGRAETIVNVAHTVPGVFHVVDEIRRG